MTKKRIILISAIVLVIVLAVAAPVLSVTTNGSAAEKCPGLQARAQYGTCDAEGNCYGAAEGNCYGEADGICDQTRDRDRDGTCDGYGNGNCYGDGTRVGTGFCDGTGKGARGDEGPGYRGGCWRR